MIRTNEDAKKEIRERLAEIRERLLREGMLENPEAEGLIKESNILNARLKRLEGK